MKIIANILYASLWLCCGIAIGCTFTKEQYNRQPIQIEVLHHDSDYEIITVKRDSLSRVPCNSRYIRVK